MHFIVFMDIVSLYDAGAFLGILCMHVVCTSGRMYMFWGLGCAWGLLAVSGLCYIDLYVPKYECLSSCENVLLGVAFSRGVFVCVCGVYTWGTGYEC